MAAEARIVEARKLVAQETKDRWSRTDSKLFITVLPVEA